MEEISSTIKIVTYLWLFCKNIPMCLDIHSIVYKTGYYQMILSMHYATSFQQQAISGLNRFHGECLLRWRWNQRNFFGYCQQLEWPLILTKVRFLEGREILNSVLLVTAKTDLNKNTNLHRIAFIACRFNVSAVFKTWYKPSSIRG